MRQLSLADWPRIRAGLEVLLSKSKQDWIPEDVYVSLFNGHSHCFEIGTGFVVVQVSPYLTGRMLFIWILYMPRGNEKHPVIDALDRLVRSFGCNVIRGHSSRDGFGRFLDGEYEAVSTVFERKINGTV